MASPCIITLDGKEYSYADYMAMLHDGGLDALVKSGVVQVGEMPKPKNEYKTSTEKTLMPDGEEGVIVTIEKPDGEKVVLDAMYQEDVESEVAKKIRGFKLSQTKNPKISESQPRVAKNIGDPISFEHAGSEHTGKIVSIDANGNYKVRDKNGVNYTVKGDGVIEQSEIDAAKSDFFNALNEYKNATDITKLGFALDPEKQAEAMFKVHKSLVNLAKAYISKGIIDVKKFAKQVGVSAKNAQQAWDEAMGRIKYTKDTVDYDLAEITKTAIRRGIDVRKKFSDYKSKQADIGKAISDFMQDAEIRSVLNAQQIKSLVSKASSVINESQLNKFIDYAEKVISDSEYVADMDELRNMQGQARKRNHVSFNGIVNEFTSINPENIPDHLLLDYKAAMDDLMGRVPSYKKMGEIFYEIQSANQKPDTFSNVKTYQQAQELYNAIALNKVSSIEEYRKLFQDINGFKRRVEQLFENGDITQDQRDDLIEQVGNDQKTVEDKYASEITSLKTDLINEIRTKQKSTGISQLSTEEKKLLDRFYKLDNDDLRSLSPEELYNLSSILDNVMEEGRVDTFRLSPLVQKAEASFEANELSSQINKAKPFSEQFNDIKEAVRKMGMTYSSFWENTLGLGAVNYGAFQKYVISPMEKAIAEYRRDVNAGYEAFNSAKKKYGIGEKEMDKIGMIAHYLREYGMQNHPRYKGKKDSKGNVIGTRDWFEFMISDAETKGKLGVDKVNELKKIWDGLPKINGNVSPEDVYNSFVNGDNRFLSSNELSFLKDVMKWQSENMTGRQKFSNELRGKPFEELMFHIKRVRKGETKSQASTPVEVSGKTGNVRIAAGSGKEVTSEEMGAIETNFEKLFAETLEENSRDYHLTQMLQKQNEVLNKARQSVSDDKKNYIDAIKQNLAASVNYEFEQSKVGKIGKVLENVMRAKASQVLIAPIRTVGEVAAALISYPARAKAFGAYKELFAKKDAVKNLMQQTNSPYLSKVDLSRQFDIGKKGIEQESTYSKLTELFAALPERMGIEPVWMAVFDQSFKKETGADFDRGKYINDPSYSQKFDKQIKAAGSVADATYGQIAGGTTRAGQRREIRILPDMVSKSFGGIKANSTAGNIASFMTGYPFREVEQILKSGSALAEASKDEEYTKGDVAKQLAPVIGVVLSAIAYNYWQALQYQLSRIALGDDEEKEKAQKDIENLFSSSGATMESASALAATLGSRYSGLSRNGMAWLGSLYYNIEDDAKRKQVAKDFVRNITFQEPFELQRKKSGDINKYMLKEKISLQAVNAVAPFAAFTDNAYKAVNSVGGWDYLVKKVEKGELLTEPEKSAIIATYVAVNMGNALVQFLGYGVPNTTINKMAKEILKKGKSSSSTQDKSEANPTPSSRFSPNVPPIQLPSRKNIYIDLAKNKP